MKGGTKYFLYNVLHVVCSLGGGDSVLEVTGNHVRRLGPGERKFCGLVTSTPSVEKYASWESDIQGVYYKKMIYVNDMINKLHDKMH